MAKFRILFHGEFAKANTQEKSFPVEEDPYEGFYASRLLTAPTADAAIIRGRELIREELDATLLRGRQGDLIALDVEELEEVESSDHCSPNRGFTFY